MKYIGALLFFFGMIAALFTATRHARYGQELSTYLKQNHKDIWSKLGKPEMNFLHPFRSFKMLKLIENEHTEFNDHSELLAKQKNAQKWLYIAMLNMAIIFLGAALLAINN